MLQPIHSLWLSEHYECHTDETQCNKSPADLHLLPCSKRLSLSVFIPPPGKVASPVSTLSVDTDDVETDNQHAV